MGVSSHGSTDGTLAETPPRGAAFLERHHVMWFVLILAFAAAFRLLLFSGYGLGDDPNYFISYDHIYRTGTWNPKLNYDIRFAFWIPVVTMMKLIGPGEAGFIGFVTLCSIWNLVVVYGLARQEWGPPAALLAMALLAVFPLDVLASTLFVIDIPLATYCFTALWLFRAGLRGRTTASRIAFALASGVVLFLAYLTKQWAVLAGALFAAEALRDVRRTWIASAVCAGIFGLLVAGYCGWLWMRFGDPIYDVHIASSVAIFEPHDRVNQLDYLKMLWLPNEYGTWFAGWYPHLLLALAAVFALRIRHAGRWLGYFLLLLVLLAAAPSHRANGHWSDPRPAHLPLPVPALDPPLSRPGGVSARGAALAPGDRGGPRRGDPRGQRGPGRRADRADARRVRGDAARGRVARPLSGRARVARLRHGLPVHAVRTA